MKLLLLAPTLLTVPSCKEKVTDPYAKIDRTHLNGIDEPLIYDLQVKDFDAFTTVDLAKILGCKSFRLRVPSNVITADGNINEATKSKIDAVVDFMIENGIRPIGQCDVFPSDSGFIKDSDRAVPYENDPNYSNYMLKVEETWEKVALLFPKIEIWEMGNESNANTFFHPNGYSGTFSNPTGGGFELLESAHILTDYMYHGTQGIHKGNPKARSLMPGLTSLNVASMSPIYSYIDEIYLCIESGDYPKTISKKSTKVDDYFDILGWHPYVLDVTDRWLEGQKTTYQVAIDHNDEGRPVIFTEFGFSDLNDAETEERQFGYFEQAYNWCLTDLPWVETICAFRMYNCKAAQSWGGLNETTFGFFKEPENGHGFCPKQKAYDLQELYGGEGDLLKYY